MSRYVLFECFNNFLVFLRKKLICDDYLIYVIACITKYDLLVDRELFTINEFVEDLWLIIEPKDDRSVS